MGTLPEEIGHWKCIQELDFSGNSLTALPESFDTLLSLKKMYLQSAVSALCTFE